MKFGNIVILSLFVGWQQGDGRGVSAQRFSPTPGRCVERGMMLLGATFLAGHSFQGGVVSASETTKTAEDVLVHDNVDDDENVVVASSLSSVEDINYEDLLEKKGGTGNENETVVKKDDSIINEQVRKRIVVW